ncbi:MAG: hypothetical protein AAGI01_03355 [Myxococcota bacterium]
MSALERQPLDIASFPPQLQGSLEPSAPPPMKMMAARGMVPAPPEVILRVLYQFQFDADHNIKMEAFNLLEQMPADLLEPSLKVEQPPAVLDWVAEVRKANEDVLQAVVLNKGVAHETVATVAGSASTSLCDLIAVNQVRILEHPQILEELYHNKNARMSTVDKLIDLASRNGVKLKGMQAVQHALDEGVTFDSDETDDLEFELILEREEEIAQAQEAAEQAQDEELERMSPSERREYDRDQARKAKEEQEEEWKKMPVATAVGQMKISQKIRVATTWGRKFAMELVKEPNRLVHMAAINNPNIQPSDVKKIVGNKRVSEGVIRYIAKNREWTEPYEVKLALVCNPKTPIGDSMSFLNFIRINDLRLLQRNRDVPRQIAREAKNLVTKRMGGNKKK